MSDPTRPATGYPAQPTNANYYYPNYNPQQYYHHAPPPPPPPRAIFLRRLFSALIATLIIFGVILFIIYLFLRPRVPIFTLTSFSLSSLNLTSTSSQISATCTANFTVVNPNKKLHVYYDQIVARLFYKSAFLTQNELPPFDQSVRNQTVLIASLAAMSAYIPPNIVGKFGEDRGKGEVKFDLQMIAVVWFSRGGWSGRKRYLRVLCDDLPVGVTVKGNNGDLIGGSRKCDVLF